MGLSLLEAKSKPSDLICIKKTQSFAEMKNNKGNLSCLKTTTEGIVTDYFQTELEDIIYPPTIFDMALITDEQFVSNDSHNKGYLFLEIIP